MAEIQFIIRVFDEISKNFVSHDSHLTIQYISRDRETENQYQN